MQTLKDGWYLEVSTLIRWEDFYPPNDEIVYIENDIVKKRKHPYTHKIEDIEYGRRVDKQLFNYKEIKEEI